MEYINKYRRNHIMMYTSLFRKVAFSVLAFPSFIIPLSANEVETVPAASSSLNSSEEAFMPSQELFHELIKIVAEPQKLIEDVDQQSVQIIGLEDDKVDLQWIWREKVDLNALEAKKTKPEPTHGQSEDVTVQDLGNGLVVTSRPMTEDIFNEIFFPHKQEGVLKVRETKELSIKEAHWLVGAFKDNAHYPDAPVLHRLFSDILEGKISTKRAVETSVDEESSEGEPESYFEHQGLETLMEILEGSVCSLSSHNRLQMMNVSAEGIMFGIKWGTGNGAGFHIGDFDQAYWLFDLLSLHPAFPDASTFRTMVKAFQQGVKD